MFVFCKLMLADLENMASNARLERSIYYTIEDRILYHKFSRDDKLQLPLVVPKTLQQIVFAEAHDALIASHLGVRRTHERLKDRYYIPGCVTLLTKY